MKEYVCEKCAKVFDQKSHYAVHINRKNACSTFGIETLVERKVQETLAKIDAPVIAGAGQSVGKMASIIRTKEQQYAYYEGIHNILWNQSGLNPEPAMENMIFFFAYRMIETQADEMGLPQECRWSHIANIKDAQTLFDTIKNGVAWFQKNPLTRPFFKPHAIRKIDTLYQIVAEINRLDVETLQGTDVLGDIFEYMLGRGMSTMPTEGQYFTDRKICSLAFKLVYDIKKTVRRADGRVLNFADFFCGTGGFVAEFIKGVKAVDPAVDWKKEKGAIHALDKNVSAVTTTLLNLLILTGTPFSSSQIREYNSFQDNISLGESAVFKGKKMDVLLLNPPYGGDKKSKDFKFKYVVVDKDTKIKHYKVNADIQSIGIEDDDKVSAGVQLAMATLAEDGGVCAIVLPQGFFFGATKKCVELRKKIAEGYRIHAVVDIAAGAFANTATKTSMMVFQRGAGPTESVKFMDMDEKILVEATLADLRGKTYSLNYKQYLPQEAVEVDGFKMVKIKDIVSFKAEKSKKDKNSYLYIDIGSVDKGQFKAGEPIAKQDLPGRAQYSVKVGDILLGTVRPNLEHYLLISPEVYRDNLIVSNGFSIMRCDTSKVLPTYLYSVLTLPTTTSYLTKRATGTTYPVIDDDIIGTMEIPLPSLERQQQIVEAIDGWTTLAHQEEQALKTLEKQVMFQVKEMGRGKERVKLGDVCDIESGTYITKKTAEEGEFPVYGGGDISCRISEFNRESKFVVAKDGVSENCVRYVPGKFFLNHHGWTFKNKENVTYAYVGYWLLNSQQQLYELATGTAQKGINQVSFYGLEIPLPLLTEQQTLQPDFDEIRHKHAKIAAYKAKAQEAIQLLIPGATEPKVVTESAEPTAVPVEQPKKKFQFKSKATTLPPP